MAEDLVLADQHALFQCYCCKLPSLITKQRAFDRERKKQKINSTQNSEIFTETSMCLSPAWQPSIASCVLSVPRPHGIAL